MNKEELKENISEIKEVIKEQQSLPDVDKAKLYSPARLENETYENYKFRQKLLKYIHKTKKQGTLVWQSMFRGTYTKDKHGNILNNNK